MDTDLALKELERGAKRPVREVTQDLDVKYRTGVYTLWHGDDFLYVGMSYIASQPSDEGDGKWGLWGRIRTHSDSRPGHLSRAIISRFIVPSLTSDEITAMQHGDDELLTRRLYDFINNEVEYRTWPTGDGAEARALEDRVRREGLPQAGRPMLNPR